MVGSRFYLNSLTQEERSKIDAMVNMDTLGLAKTEVWQSHADIRLSKIAAMVSHAMNLPLSAVNADGVGSTDSESFREKKIPSIAFHSLTQETLPLLHTDKDQLSAVNLEHLYESYKLIAAYLAYLDTAEIPEH
jgi:Zn-dependent M28 family amino/carboxypeptidase